MQKTRNQFDTLKDSCNFWREHFFSKMSTNSRNIIEGEGWGVDRKGKELRFRLIPKYKKGNLLSFQSVYFVLYTSRCVEMKVDDHIFPGKKSGRKIILFHDKI